MSCSGVVQLAGLISRTQRPPPHRLGRLDLLTQAESSLDTHEPTQNWLERPSARGCSSAANLGRPSSSSSCRVRHARRQFFSSIKKERKPDELQRNPSRRIA